MLKHAKKHGFLRGRSQKRISLRKIHQHLGLSWCWIGCVYRLILFLCDREQRHFLWRPLRVPFLRPLASFLDFSHLVLSCCELPFEILAKLTRSNNALKKGVMLFKHNTLF